MKKVFIIVAVFFVYIANSQNITFRFSATDFCQHVNLDSVHVENLSRNCDTVIYYPDTVLTIYFTKLNENQSNLPVFRLLPNFPNPYHHETFFKLLVNSDDHFTIDITDITGKLAYSSQFLLAKGEHAFKISGCGQRIYILTVRSKSNLARSLLLQNYLCDNSNISITYLHGTEIPLIKSKSSVFEFHPGDHLKCTGYFGNLSNIINDSPLNSTDYVFNFNNQPPQPPVFVQGDSLACANSIASFTVMPQQGATFVWTLPLGWTLISGAGTNSITVNTGNSSGYVIVYAYNACGNSTTTSFTVNLQSVPVPPTEAVHFSTENQIQWNWLPVSNATTYYWNTSSDINTAQAVSQNQLLQSNLTCNQNYTIYVWSANSCGISQPSMFQFFTNTCPPCSDICIAGDTSSQGVCALWDNTIQTWFSQINDGWGQLHNRARKYQYYLRKKLMPYGGIFRTIFTDSTYQTVLNHSGKRDAAIWTGIYLASESFRYAVTGSPEAAQQMDKTIRTLNLWWSISGNPGYLARYVAPANCPPEVQNIFEPANDFENHLNFSYNGQMWHWKGNVSRDQYQGVLFGYSIAYEMTDNDTLKEMIRSKIVEFVEQLMAVQTKTIRFVINGVPLTKTMNIQYAVYNTHESTNGDPTITITLNPFDQQEQGILTFWPNPSQYIRQLPGFSWVPDYWQRSQIIQLASAFAVALRVTEGVPSYAARRQAILNHYLANVNDWISKASGWTNTNDCGDSYHGLNIVMIPMYNWVRLETDPGRKLQLQNNVFKNRLWNAVQDHKNVFFAYLFASQADPSYDVSTIISSHNAQLAQFPPSPYMSRPVDNTGLYPEDPNCPGLSSIAIDVQHRVPAGFIWEKNPWKLTDPGTPNFMMPGVDYLIAYWMGRYYGYIPDDAPNTCLKWKPISK